MRRIRLARLVVTAAMLSGCGSSSDSHSSVIPHTTDMPTAAGTAMGTAANATDVMFAQMMVPHHEQAVAMADLAAAMGVTSFPSTVTWTRHVGSICQMTRIFR